MSDPHIIPLQQEGNLDQVTDLVMQIMDEVPDGEGALTLVAGGLDLLPAGRCRDHLRRTLLDVRAEVDRLLAELEERAH